jgi:hypothetical protein
MFYFSTYFDKNYLTSALVLIDSLEKHCKDFTLFILCLDDFTYRYFNKNNNTNNNIQLISLRDIECYDVELKGCKNNRSLVEYYFTLSPCLPLYILNKFNIEHICSLDADIKFYSNPEELFNNLNEFSIIVTPHKFSFPNKEKIIYGKNNVSFQIFKNNTVGRNCLEDWRKKCIEWCYDELDDVNSRFADQKYLDTWINEYPGEVKELYDSVSGLAPWNTDNYKIEYKNNLYYSDNLKIIYFHFQRFKILSNRIAFNAFKEYNIMNQKQLAAIYLDYWKSLKKISEEINYSHNLSQKLRGELNVRNLIINNSCFLYCSKNYIINLSKAPMILRRIIYKLYA